MAKKYSDEQLAKMTVSDKDNFNELVDRYAEKIQRYVARITGNRPESEDLTQEVFLKSYQNIASFNSKLKFSSWLYRIAHNESVNLIKKHYRTKHVSFNDEIKNKFQEDNLALKKIIDSDNSRQVRQSLEKMKLADREILELSYFEEKSYLEIADILEISVNSVGPKIKRAKDNLKKIILSYDKTKRKN